MKGVLQGDHIPTNKYRLTVLGVEFTFTSISGLDRKVGVVDLPDRTKAPDGVKKAMDFEVSLPSHHTAEVLAMEAWFAEVSDPVLPTYKKPATLEQISLSGAITRTYTLLGVWTSGPKLPDMKMEDEGTMAEITWQMHCDDVQIV